MTFIDTTTSTAILYQTTVIQRRLRVSPSVARSYAAHAFGDSQRSDFTQLAALTADRIASTVEVRS